MSFSGGPKNLKKLRVFAISGFLGLLGASMLAYMGDPGPKRPQEGPKEAPNLCHFQLFKTKDGDKNKGSAQEDASEFILKFLHTCPE